MLKINNSYKIEYTTEVLYVTYNYYTDIILCSC